MVVSECSYTGMLYTVHRGYFLPWVCVCVCVWVHSLQGPVWPCLVMWIPGLPGWVGGGVRSRLSTLCVNGLVWSGVRWSLTFLYLVQWFLQSCAICNWLTGSLNWSPPGLETDLKVAWGHGCFWSYWVAKKKPHTSQIKMETTFSKGMFLIGCLRHNYYYERRPLE